MTSVICGPPKARLSYVPMAEDLPNPAKPTVPAERFPARAKTEPDPAKIAEFMRLVEEARMRT